MVKTITLISIVIFVLAKLNKSMEIWKEKNYAFSDYNDINTSEKSKCTENEICENNFDDLFKRNSQESERKAYALEFEEKTPRLAPHYHSARPMPCSCGIEFRLLDLGHQYYPRYLHTGMCKSEVCGGLYRCVEKHYKVRVLKQRDPRNPETKTTMALPDTLKASWQPEMVTVTVACECSL